MLKPLLEFVIKKIVNTPEQVEIKEVLMDDKNILTVKVATDDISRVIGKDGRTFKALRTIVTSLGSGNDDLVIDSK